MIQVIASIKVKPDHKEEFIEIFKANVADVLSEDGCIDYQPMVDFQTDIAIQKCDSSIITVVEKWESIDHLKAHFTAPHMLSYKAKVADFVESVTLKILEEA